MLIQLPIEVWMDILDWLRGHRRELAEKCEQTKDKTFSEILQIWLHKCSRNIQLSRLLIAPKAVCYKEGAFNKYEGRLVRMQGSNYLDSVPVPFTDVPTSYA